MVWTAADRAKAARKRRGHHLSRKTRAKISAKVSKRQRGRKHPHKGHRNSTTTRKKISNALKGRKRTKRRTLTASERKAIADRQRGKKHPHKGSKGIHHIMSKRKKSNRLVHHRMQTHGTVFKTHHRLAQHFKRLTQIHHRKHGGMSNEAVLNKKLRRPILGRQHGMTNKGVLHTSGHHFRRHL